MMAMGLSACGGSSNNAAAVTGGSNAAPVVTFVIAEMPEDSPIEFTLPAVDDDDDTLTFSAVSQPENGTVAIVGNKATYTPADNFNGQDGFTFKANDGVDDSNTAAVTINIAVVNDAPEAVALSINTHEDTAVEVVLSATDVDNDALTYAVVTPPTLGSLSAVNGSKVIYTPAGNANGDDSFGFKANDSKSDSSAVKVTVNIAAVNDAPIASVASAINTDENTPVEITLNATDTEGDELTYLIVTEPVDGSVVFEGGIATYTPNANYRGADSFTYLANDGDANSNTVTVSIVVDLTAKATGKLNDTGSTQCADGNSYGLSCPVADYPNQDAQYGRDVTDNDDSDGHAGFSFTKVDANGKTLLANATAWSCVKDNVTGLIWEVKRGGNDVYGDEGLRDADDEYSWHSTEAGNNVGMNNPPINRANCFGGDGEFTDYCNTKAYVDRVNVTRLCAANDWRVPSQQELQSLMHYGNFLIHSEYFPNSNNRYWSSTPAVEERYDSSLVARGRAVGLGGRTFIHGVSTNLNLRLVRGGQ